jgi:predicted amidohydrolase
LARARALDSTSYVLAAGQGDPVSVDREVGRAPTGIGYSLAVSPLGEIIDSLGPEPALLVVDVDPVEVAAARQALPVLANRRL